MDEPLYAHYLRVSGADHPHVDEVLAAMEQDGEKVVCEVILGPCDRPVLFMKQMAHHLVALDWRFLRHTANVLLIRDPAEVLPSLSEQLPSPILRDTGLDKQAQLLHELAAMGQEPPVLDARELLLDPPGVLAELCRRLGIPFEEAMLRWPPGGRAEDGIWAPYWYHNVHRSTGFQPYQPKTDPFPARLLPLLEECRPYYEVLYKTAIKPGKRSSSGP